ncbi:fimbrial protein [Achromobacter sp. NPDC058515]|uniref:fimbrial protein n=1 Tax=Achromobacter sp. NPDC058515 TaxID=3346533 RepID=UPI003662180D
MKTLSLSTALLSALVLSAAAQAAPTVGAQGKINFTGDINADACTVAGSGMASRGVFNYDMGSVSNLSLGTEDAPATSSTNLPSMPIPVELTLQCATGTQVTLALTPAIASGKGVGVSGLATGAQIMLTKATDGSIIDFTAGTNTIPAGLDSNGKVTVSLLAYYTRKAGVAAAAVTPGTANGTVNYVLSYE